MVTTISLIEGVGRDKITVVTNLLHLRNASQIVRQGLGGPWVPSSISRGTRVNSFYFPSLCELAGTPPDQHPELV